MSVLSVIPKDLARGEHTLPDGVVVVMMNFGAVSWRSDCTECARRGKNTPGPDHDAMRNCRSGGHPHCTCDGCF